MSRAFSTLSAMMIILVVIVVGTFMVIAITSLNQAPSPNVSGVINREYPVSEGLATDYAYIIYGNNGDTYTVLETCQAYSMGQPVTLTPIAIVMYGSFSFYTISSPAYAGCMTPT